MFPEVKPDPLHTAMSYEFREISGAGKSTAQNFPDGVLHHRRKFAGSIRNILILISASSKTCMLIDACCLFFAIQFI